MHVGHYLSLLADSQRQLMEGLRTVAKHHSQEPDILQMCQLLASWSQAEVEALKPLQARYPPEKKTSPEPLLRELFHGPRKGALALVRDLHDLWLLASQVHLCIVVLDQAALALRDEELHALTSRQGALTDRQSNSLMTRIKQAAPQALVVA